jgi:Tol biopolymer transport system component
VNAGRGRLPGPVALALAFAGLALAAHFLLKPPEPSGTVRTSLPAPEGSRFNFFAGPMALSSDGKSVAFVSTGSDGKNLLWAGAVVGPPARPLSGTAGASYPFWSPDGRFLAFFAEKKLKKIAAAGGAAEALCDAEDGRGGSWSRGGDIVFAPAPRGPILRVTATGGAPVPVTRLDPARRENGHLWPFFLPDGRRFLYLAQTAGAGTEGRENSLCAGSLDSKTGVVLMPANSNMAWAPSSGGGSEGHVLLWRAGALLARRFDAKSLRWNGEPFPVANPVQYIAHEASAVFALSGNGLLAFQEGSAVGMSQLVWFDRSGRQLETVGGPSGYAQPRLSPEGRRIAIDLVDSETLRRDVWIFDLSAKTESRLTLDPGAASIPQWSPDGARILFSSGRNARLDLYEKPAAGSADEDLLLSSEELKQATDWSADGRSVAFMSTERDSGMGWDLWILTLPQRKAVPFLRTRFNEASGQFSPDARWIAYSSDETGKNEIYVQAFPGGGKKRQISLGGAAFPRWRRDGKEILYVAPGGRLMSVEVKPGPVFEASAPRNLFAALMASDGFYDVSADGERILINVAPAEQPAVPVSLVRNWASAAPRVQ